MEELSQSLHETNLQKSVSFSRTIGKQQVAADFNDYILPIESQIEPSTFEVDTICVLHKKS